ncbi:hypothetical protein V3C99_018639, partial [Haemonchus contortus]
CMYINQRHVRMSTRLRVGPPRARAWQVTRGFHAKNSNRNGPHSPEPEGAPNTAALGRTARERLL